jgi:hypothetical protein
MRKDHISLRRREKQNPVRLTPEPLSYTTHLRISYMLASNNAHALATADTC